MNVETHLQLVTAPARQAITTRDAKAYLRVEHRDEDSVIDQLVLGATQHLERYTRRAFVTQTYDLFIDCFPTNRGKIELPMPPLASIVEIEYTDPTGTTQAMDVANDIRVMPAGLIGSIEPVFGTSWPATRRESQAVRIRFTCGWGDTNAIPEGLKTAVAILTATYYENREDYALGTIAVKLPVAVKNLVYPWRVLNTTI